MSIRTFIVAFAIFFLPGFLIAWDARRRGRRWIVWFIFAIAGPLLSILGSFSMPGRDPVVSAVYALTANPLSYLAYLLAIAYLVTRPWRSPIVR